MKYLILFLLFLNGCSRSDYMYPTDPNKLVFKAGDEVKTNIYFYSGCAGEIIGFRKYQENGHKPDYMVNFYCPNVMTLKENTVVSEENLTLVKRSTL